MAKKKAGPNKVNKIKTSNFLPSVFQTDFKRLIVFTNCLKYYIMKKTIKNIWYPKFKHH